MYIVRHSQCLTLSRCTGRRELASLQSVVQPERSEVKERRQDAVYTVVTQVVQLPLAHHRQSNHRNLHLVGFQGYIVAVEVSAVIHVLRYGIDYRIVARGVQFFLYHLTAVRECVKDRTKNLRSTA